MYENVKEYIFKVSFLIMDRSQGENLKEALDEIWLTSFWVGQWSLIDPTNTETSVEIY